ncbi:unnamed protein product, partial [Iphiclides podalirius]
MQARAGGEAARRRADRGSAYFRAPSREPQLTGRVSVCACSEWNVLGRMRILLSELGLSGGCLDLTLEPRAASLDPDKPAPEADGLSRAAFQLAQSAVATGRRCTCRDASLCKLPLSVY